MQDAILDQNGDFLIKNGDMVVDDATGQHQTIMIISEKGTLRQYGDSGVGAPGYLLDNNEADLLREISKELKRDGQAVKKIKLDNAGKIDIDASYL